MVKIKEAVIVEGRYDKIKLSSLIDTMIIETNGFEIFKDKEKLAFIRMLAETRGIVILTDSDSAGFKIRSYLKGCIDKSYVKHAYIPDIYGKERRKTEISKEGKLGVEGMPPEVIFESLERAGVTVGTPLEKGQKITRSDLYNAGLSGGINAAEKRKALLKKLNLPERMSTSVLLDTLNTITDYDGFIDMLETDACSTD